MVEEVRSLAPALSRFLPFLAVVVVLTLGLIATSALLRRRAKRNGTALSFGRQIGMLAITAFAIVAALLTLPVSETTRGQLLSLFGIVLTGLIAFSSTTFVANAMAGLMLRAVGSFRPGDWVRVGDQFGRVTERGLFHTEIQTEDRDLATLPNLHLVTNPVVVVLESGTIVSVRLSLGYDQHHTQVEGLLLEAARGAELEDPFVQVVELGDFSVTYRVAGLLTEVKALLTARSRLRTSVLDTLHEAGVEIVSPNFMNQRQLADRRILPSTRERARPAAETPMPEEIIFDKADEKAALEDLSVERERLQKEVEALEETVKTAEPREKAIAEVDIERRRARMEVIDATLAREAELEGSESGG